MVDWLNKNINVEEYEYGMKKEELESGINWKLRLQDFSDQELMSYFNINNGEKRWYWILHDLATKARRNGKYDVENHLNGFANEAEYQAFLADAIVLQKKMEEMCEDDYVANKNFSKNNVSV